MRELARKEKARPKPEPSLAELSAIGLTRDEVHAFKSGEACKFWFVRADRVRTATLAELPKLQHLRGSTPDWLVHRKITFVEGIRGSYKAKVLVISHRWEAPEEPDEHGTQLRAIQKHLEAHPEIELVWYDVRAAAFNAPAPPFP